MSEQEIGGVETKEEWDLDGGGVGRPIPNRRSVVSVSLSHADFVTIATTAEQHNMKISAFMRHASLQMADQSNVLISSIQGTFTVSFLGAMTNGAFTSGSGVGGSEVLKAEKSDRNLLSVETEQTWAA